MPTPTTIQISEKMRESIYRFIKKNGYITNRQCRELLNISYDQAINLFNQMVENKELKREGKASATKYTRL
jgi:predicted HTH transcriptional regulator